MIEFKAECGHTIRARNEDAGGVVQCAYCGREAVVPDTHSNDLNFLYAEVEQASEAAAAAAAKPRHRRRERPKPRRGPTDVNPFSIVLYMIYAAVLFTIVVVVGKEFVLPMFQQKPVERKMTDQVETDTPTPQESLDGEVAVHRVLPPGLVSGGACTGIYFSSWPPNADVYVLAAEDAPATGSLRDVHGCVRTVAADQWETKWNGEYVVEISLPWSHKSLNDESLPYAAQYLAFRRSLLAASEDERTKLVEDFFIPDGASEVFVYENTPDQLDIGRRYRGVRVGRGRYAAIRALFIPRIKATEAQPAPLDVLIDNYFPKSSRYTFDEDYVRRELAFWDIPSSDYGSMIRALQRVGVIPYVFADGRSRVFMIDVCNGEVTTRSSDESSE